MSLYRRHRYQINATLITGLMTVILFLILISMTRISSYVAWLTAISLATFALFGVDKTLSRSGGARVPESVLHLFTLLGGFPGQIAGRLVFRHKTNFRRHPMFNIVLVISIILQVGIVYFFVI